MDGKPKLTRYDEQILRSIAHQELLNRPISVEQAWWYAAMSLLTKLGYKIVDAKNEEPKSTGHEG